MYSVTRRLTVSPLLRAFVRNDCVPNWTRGSMGRAEEVRQEECARSMRRTLEECHGFNLTEVSETVLQCFKSTSVSGPLKGRFRHGRR